MLNKAKMFLQFSVQCKGMRIFRTLRFSDCIFILFASLRYKRKIKTDLHFGVFIHILMKRKR